MKKKSISETSADDCDEYPDVTQKEIDRATFRVNMKPVEKNRESPF